MLFCRVVIVVFVVVAWDKRWVNWTMKNLCDGGRDPFFVDKGLKFDTVLGSNFDEIEKLSGERKRGEEEEDILNSIVSPIV